ncbi:pyridoxamine 5'-phosphate oxidase [Legionella israelensis]|uniref:Pyridoxine/pyridoxamine 5'-phosphate oxidase n=1 Tax=Legionella israelensis TaxID=454 RepID=A0A0W0W2F3_9GAMM|nr:pyridoxamine 5'-phosphate oxidase [Legionella israelensis]KTD26086.1 pyridoxamine 5'-phosphate oxidase [Legionella israelensis]QBS10127.1 pyridoxamine 5'-phosphate oxidase [Legionella israelensis]SCY07598.1 Pyridoxamine 5'-phosphate oxidase [Legionella israelensis DSM 19235]STX59714.1 pyridoxamine 5'-phosphate oxidase [Legionella israelensis]
MNEWRTLADIRREYGELSLSEESASSSPIAQFKLWFEEVLKSEKSDPTAMVLSTADEKGYPDSRVVLLKALQEEAFIFFTNYQSTKAMQLQHNPYAALNFYWPQMARQVRVRGRVKCCPKEQSDNYFASRPVKSQYSAIASPQSREISDRAFLERKLNELIQQYGQKPVMRPDYWGGYMILPDEIEFWQGRDNRLHDRIHYYKQHNQWIHRRLAP